MINFKYNLKTINSNNSSLSVLEDIDCGFDFKRVYLLHNFKKKTTRGCHYHKDNRQMIICLKERF